MTRKQLLMLLGSVCLTLVLVLSVVAGCAGPTPSPTPTPTPSPSPSPTASPTPAPSPEAEVYKWKMQCFGERGSFFYDVHQRAFSDYFREISGGRIQIEMFGVNELYPMTEALSAVKTGYAELSVDTGAYHIGTYPGEAVATGLPGGLRSVSDTQVFYYNEDYAYLDWQQKNVFNDLGIKVIGPSPQGGWCIWSNKPVREIADIEGMKIRTPGIPSHILASLGAKIVELAGAEVYAAGMQGVIDGCTRGGIAEMYGVKMYEPFPYIFFPKILDFSINRVIMSLESWNKLPDDIKSILSEGMYGCMLIYCDMQTYGSAKALSSMVAAGQIKEVTELSSQDQVTFQQAKLAQWDIIAEESPLDAESVEMLKRFATVMGY